MPDLKLPLVAVKSRHAAPESIALAERARHAIFADPEIAKRVTGYFKIIRGKSAPRLDIQMKRDCSGPRDAAEVKERLRLSGAEISPLAYYEFPEALVLDYNRKFHH